MKDIVNKHAPLKKATKSKRKQLSKPWLTQGLLKSIKRKQKMYISHFFSKNPVKVKEYKQYSNLLNKMKAPMFPAAQRNPERNMEAYWYNH